MIKIWSLIRHNPGLSVGVPLCCCVLFWVYACQSSVVSLVNPNIMITRVQLVAEVDSMLAEAESKFEDLDRQDLVKGTIFNSVLDLASGKAIDPLSIIITLAGILGIGAGVDNIKKATYINTLKGAVENVKVKEKN